MTALSSFPAAPSGLPNAVERALPKIFAVMEEATRAAGILALTWFCPQKATNADIALKADNSPVTQADMAVNALLHERLDRAFPDFGWLSEENEDTAARLDKEFVFIVDPIDGTRGFIDGNPNFAISIGLAFKGEIVAGIVHCPALDACYHARKGKGAWCNEARIFAKAGYPQTFGQTSPVMTLFGPRSTLSRLMAGGHPIHVVERLPSLACRLIKIAEGAVDGGLIGAGANDWDIAGAAIILAEAGALLRTHHGAPLTFNTGTTTRPPLVACCAGLYPALATLAREAVFPE